MKAPLSATLMRWHFIDPANETELAYKRQKQAAISTFWKSFEEDAEKLFEAMGKRELDSIIDWVEVHLPKVDPNIMWDVSAHKIVEALFVLTPESKHGMRPLIEYMIESAPRVPNWRFASYREPHADSIKEVNDSRIKKDFSDLRFVAYSKNFNIVDVVFVSSHFKKDNDEDDLGCCLLIIELMLGEELLDKWIGSIETRAHQRPLQEKIVNLFGRTKHNPTEGSLPVDELLTHIISCRDQIVSSLSDKPYSAGTFNEFTGIFAQASQNRLPSRFTFNTALPNVISALNNRSLFHSERFSKCGETFCYLKIGDMENIRSSVETRGAVEDKLDAALREAEAGCVFGGGAGQEYAFIDLVLTDVSTAIPILRDLAKSESFSNRSWLLFHDSPMSDEWVGMTPASPLPERNGNEW